MSGECQDGDCVEVLRELETYLDGELDTDRAAALTEHLGKCSPCQDHADLEAHVRSLLKSRCAEAAPPTLVAKLQERLQEWSVSVPVAASDESGPS